MFKLDLQLFNSIYNYCEMIGSGFGFGAIEGFFINFVVVSGTILIALNSKGANKK